MHTSDVGRGNRWRYLVVVSINTHVSLLLEVGFNDRSQFSTSHYISGISTTQTSNGRQSLHSLSEANSV